MRLKKLLLHFGLGLLTLAIAPVLHNPYHLLATIRGFYAITANITTAIASAIADEIGVANFINYGQLNSWLLQVES
ncbi:MAG TPA: hypothetical protein DDW76_21245 [Cyanobacteria bacterium UBA11369]|nr:hypothetical protein [Cyanobacteria bacterium UBA11371]HBE35897.1 hypothetical protein [Cyanobacteria bacterium UBA11368]HBE51227.1 hypothetical protein [Cyanobacteria bacterium UBA11369]